MSKHVKVVLSCRNTFPHWNPKIGKLKVSPIWCHIVDINLTGFDGNLKQSLLVKGTLLEQFVQQKKFLKLYFCSQLAVKFVWCLYIILCFILLLYLWYLCIVSSIIPFAYLTENKKTCHWKGKRAGSRTVVCFVLSRWDDCWSPAKLWKRNLRLLILVVAYMWLMVCNMYFRWGFWGSIDSLFICLFVCLFVCLFFC